MREADRNKELLALFGIEPHRHMLAIGRRRAPEVDRHVEDCPLQHPNQLGLRKRSDLEMQSPHGPNLRRERLVVLHHGIRHAGCRQHVRPIRLRKPATIVAKPRRTDELYGWDCLIQNFHDRLFKLCSQKINPLT